LSSTNPAWTDLSANPVLRGEKPATNRLSYGTVKFIVRFIRLRRMRWAGHVARMEEVRNEIFVGKPTRKRQIRRLWRRWWDNIKIDLQQIVYEAVDWIQVNKDTVQRRGFVKTVMTI
jgi:hypothetical protein